MRARGKRACVARALLFGVAATATMTATTITATAATAEPEFALVLHEHRFTPAEITVPAGKRVRLIVDNQDAGPEEFDSHALNREKVIPGGTKATIYIGPLAPGRYEFIGEFNATTARGAVVAK